MKKYIIALVTIVAAVLVFAGYHTFKVNHYYEHFTPYSKLVKEIVVDTRYQDCCRDYGTYKIVYRKYNYVPLDSAQYAYWKDSITVTYWLSDQGDTICIKYSNASKGRRTRLCQ